MTLATNPAAASALASRAGTNELRDIKPPVDIPGGWAWLWWALAGLVLAALLYVAWRLRGRRRLQVALPVVVPPHVRARHRLQDALSLIGQPREFCIVVSDTLRVYLEERFDFRAPERTTEEFLYELRGTTLLTPTQKERLGEFLQRCDLVKFARYEPAEPELRDLHAAALRLVEETEPKPVPTASEPQPPPPAPRHSTLDTRHSPLAPQPSALDTPPPPPPLDTRPSTLGSPPSPLA